MESGSAGVRLDGKVLLTGASGFIGGRLRARLLADGTDVLSVRRAGSPVPKEGRSVALDYGDLAGLERLVDDERPNFVVHVAGSTKGVTYDDFHRANVVPTENLLRAVVARHPAVERFTLVSSLAAFGPSAPGAPLDESSPRQPVEFYGKSKLEAEQVLEQHGAALRWSIVRPAGVYGPGDGDYFQLFREATKGRNVFFGNREKLASMIYVDDLVEAILLATVRPEAIGKGYLLSDDHPVTWGQFQGHIVAQSGRKAMTLDFPSIAVDLAAVFGELASRIDGKPRLFNRQKAIMGAQVAWTCSAAAARRELGFIPRVQVEEGVAKTFAWYREQKWL
jgi:nucleoside-diphosphate-sugar epimerase